MPTVFIDKQVAMVGKVMPHNLDKAIGAQGFELISMPAACTKQGIRNEIEYGGRVGRDEEVEKLDQVVNSAGCSGLCNAGEHRLQVGQEASLRFIGLKRRLLALA